MDKKAKIIIGVLVALLVVAIGVIIFLVVDGKDKDDKTKKDPETKQVERPGRRPEVKEKQEELEKEKTPEEETKEETKKDTKKPSSKNYKIKEVLFDTTSYGNDDVEKVELTTDGVVLVSITGTGENDVTRKEVAKNVVKTFVVQVGQADICEGNKRIMFIHKNGTASYINIDELTCGQEIDVDDLEGFKNIEKFEVKTVKYDGEPDAHITYVITKDGKKTDISDEID